MTRAGPWVLLCAIVGACAPARAFADDTTAAASSDVEARRTALYREGIALANAGRWAEAVKRFREVVAIRAAPPALFTLAQAEEHTGELASAERTYERALASARSTGTSDVADAAARALSAIEPRVPRLVIQVGGVDKATATIDGSPAPIDDAVKVDPGERLVSVSALGRKPFQRTVRIAEGQTVDVRATLEPVAESAPAPPPAVPATEAPPPAREHGHFPVVPVVLGAIGIGVGAAGLAVRLVGQSRYDSARSNCSTGNVCTLQSEVDDGNAGRTEIIWGTVLLGAGAAAAASAAVIWFLGAHDGDARDDGVHVGVLSVPSGAGAALSGRF